MSKDAGGPPDNGRIQEMQRQIEEMRRAIGNMAQATALENVVQQGFASLSSQLEPLREMSPEREIPGRDAIEKFNRVLKAIEQPKWRGSEFDAEPRRDDSCQRSN